MKIEIDDEKRVVKINGIEYTYAVFENCGITGMPLGTAFMLLNRDHLLTIRRFSEEVSKVLRGEITDDKEILKIIKSIDKSSR